jgi:hypothetical protein
MTGVGNAPAGMTEKGILRRGPKAVIPDLIRDPRGPGGTGHPGAAAGVRWIPALRCAPAGMTGRGRLRRGPKAVIPDLIRDPRGPGGTGHLGAAAGVRWIPALRCAPAGMTGRGCSGRDDGRRPLDPGSPLRGMTGRGCSGRDAPAGMTGKGILRRGPKAVIPDLIRDPRGPGGTGHLGAAAGVRWIPALRCAPAGMTGRGCSGGDDGKGMLRRG